MKQTIKNILAYKYYWSDQTQETYRGQKKCIADFDGKNCRKEETLKTLA
jgi:hypothetical protein